MVICKDLKKIKKMKESVLSIGSFDGMHLGHADLINAAQSMAKSKQIPSVIITFDPHPKFILTRGSKIFQQLMRINEKLNYLKGKGVDNVLIIPFDMNFSKLSADYFLKKYIINYFNPTDIIIGYDHCFGFKREGDENFLNKNKKLYGYNVHTINPIYYKDNIVSSALIRSYIISGQIEKANDCLGWQYGFSGKIVHGDGIGTYLGFPTANILPTDASQLIPARGVYSVDVIIGNQQYLGMCNIGSRPTFYANGREIIEVHLLSNKKLNLYNNSINIQFKKFIRKEKKYSTKNKLVRQLQLDREVCFNL